MMKEKVYKGPERRQFLRLDYVTPLAYKVCKKETLSILLQGYTSNISQSGLLCNIKESVKKDDILWVSFDRTTLNVCEDLEKRSLIYQNGIVGKVVRAERKIDGTYDVGIQFVTREEKNLTNIYPQIYFLERKQKDEET
jgi:c-di-GMP-binding flagellar brake protein YcgR